MQIVQNSLNEKLPFIHTTPPKEPQKFNSRQNALPQLRSYVYGDEVQRTLPQEKKLHFHKQQRFGYNFFFTTCICFNFFLVKIVQVMFLQLF